MQFFQGCFQLDGILIIGCRDYRVTRVLHRHEGVHLLHLGSWQPNVAVLPSRHFPVFEDTGCDPVHLHAEGLPIPMEISYALAGCYDGPSDCAVYHALDSQPR